MIRATRDDVGRALLALSGALSATLEERPGAVVVRLTWRVGMRWPLGDVRDAVRDAMRDAMPAGVRWVALVNGSFVVRAAALSMHTSRPHTWRVGQRVVHASATWRQLHDGLPLWWHLARVANAALWWRRRDLHQVTRVGERWIECERLRWSWTTWRWVIDWRPADDLEALFGGLVD